MKIYVINGANLNMLGIREPEHYGKESYAALEAKIREHCEVLGIECTLFQSNHEGALVDKIQEAYFSGADGIVINPGAYTHTSIALLDAVGDIVDAAGGRVIVADADAVGKAVLRDLHLGFIHVACVGVALLQNKAGGIRVPIEDQNRPPGEGALFAQLLHGRARENDGGALRGGGGVDVGDQKGLILRAVCGHRKGQKGKDRQAKGE